MGDGFYTHCTNCDESDEYITGVGMLYGQLENVMPFITGKAMHTITDINNIFDIDSSDYEHKVLACPSCNTLHNRFYVKVEYGDGKVFETAFRCGKCRASLINAKHSIEHYNCKKCGMKTLEKDGEMLWD